MSKLILASASPRRKELLEQAGFRFEIEAAGGEEIILGKQPWEEVENLALCKSMEIFGKHADDIIVLGADTVVAYEDEILGKPTDEKDAFRMLSMLQGKKHHVYTGVAVLYREKGLVKKLNFHETTEVEVYSMSEHEINSYIATKDPMDKAGAYGIQGSFAIYVKQITGDYNNVVGLPIARIYQELKRDNLLERIGISK